MSKDQPYRPNWVAADDRRRQERAYFSPGSGDIGVICGLVASNITAPMPGTPITPTTFQLTRLMMTTDGNNKLMYPPYEDPQPDTIPNDDDLIPYQETIYNFDSSVTYTMPTDKTKTALCIAVLMQGVYVPVWIGCP